LSATNKTIAQDAIEIKEHWRKLWYAMADGDTNQYEKIKALDIFEFWAMYDNWKQRIEAKKNAYK
jgi:hypothetical protein